jgi:hypothetical protein
MTTSDTRTLRLPDFSSIERTHSEPENEQEFLLELALELQRWPVRNTVFRKALDSVAGHLAQMASRAQAT